MRLWDAVTGQSLATLEGHAGVVWAVALTADSQVVASGGGDGTVRLWDFSTGRPLATFQGHRGAVRAVALSADGQLGASGGQDGAVQLWDASAGQLFATLAGHAGGRLKGNLHLRAADGTPMANVFLTALHALGLDDVDTFGDSTGTVDLTGVPVSTTAQKG